MNANFVFGIGNPLIDITITATDEDLISLGINKGTMELVDEKRQKEIFDYFQSSEPRFNPGGSAPNTILACAALGAHSHISGKIGKDHFADIYLKRVNQYGADSGLVQENGTTGSSIILVTPDGERSMNTHLGMCREYSSDNIDVKKLSRSNYLYFTGYMWDTESQKSAIQKAISVAHENKIKIVFDIADPFVVERNRNEFLELIKNDVDIVFANHVELKILFNSESIEHATNALIDIVDSAGINLGKKGSIIF
jgi:Sugar kinases, ribokinase family